VEQEEGVIRAGNDPQYGVAKINAPQVWAKGNKGEGIVVGIIDTGANVQHIALIDNYKNDSYSWHDAFGKYPLPHDGNGHGTHCAGKNKF
jgi:subtilisin family serine protease